MTTRSFKKGHTITLIAASAILLMWGILALWFLIFSRAGLRNGDLSMEWLKGTGLTARTGVYYYASRIPTEEYGRFLHTSTNESDKAIIITLLGWNNRQDALDVMRHLAKSDDHLGRCATLSAVALEEHMQFEGRNMAEEFDDRYALPAIQLAKDKKIPLDRAAHEIAAK